MSATRTNFQLARLANYRGPGLFLGGGVLAGLLLFLVWLSSLPSANKTSSAAQPAAVAGVGGGPLTPGGSVLGGVTGTPTTGQADASLEPVIESEESAEGAENEEFADGATTDSEDAASSAEIVSDEQAIANGLLDDRGGAQAAPAAGLQTYYVEVMPESGELEILEVNAESPEHAHSIIRDFRGNPRITRGPSTQPLD